MVGWRGEGSWVGEQHPRPREPPVGVPRGQNELGVSEDRGTMCTGWAGAPWRPGAPVRRVFCSFHFLGSLVLSVSLFKGLNPGGS